jgi:FMN reductase
MTTRPHGPPRIVGLGGSLSRSSTSRRALEIALDAAAAAGAETDLLDVGSLGLPFYGAGVPPTPATNRLAEAVAAADGMIWSSPLYHGSVSGAFKNALDWLQLLADRERPYLAGVPVGLIATAGGTHALQAVNTMEFVVRALRGWTVPFVVPLARSWQAFDADGRPRDDAVADRLATLGGEVVSAARRLTGAAAG